MIYLLFGCCYGVGYIVGGIGWGIYQIYKTVKFLTSPDK